MQMTFDKFVDITKPKAEEFLRSVPFNELTSKIKEHLGLEVLDINYKVIETKYENGVYQLGIKYTSNNLVENSKLLKTIFKSFKVESFDTGDLFVFTRQGKLITDTLWEELEDFDPEEPVKFQYSISIGVQYIATSSGYNSVTFAYATYNENDGWTIEWYN